MSGVSRAAWVKIYKDLLRASNEFPQYNFRLFARRRVRDYFELNRSVTDQGQLAKFFEEAKSNLKNIQRQTAISKSYPHNKIIIEEPSPAQI
uniref:Complex 1 LYR protein domain-containing protein n=1 Tax=Panagrolaimus superbus TaxID=310955 RepID=A0A914Z506_9BILA